MSYQGAGAYMPISTVDEVADYTDMQGQASAMNVAASQKGAWKSDPTKSLVALWVFVVLLYFALGIFFRRHLA
jgi:hypothetical protein